MICGRFGAKGSFYLLLLIRVQNRQKNIDNATIGPVNVKILLLGLRDGEFNAGVSCSRKIDVSALRIGADQFYAQLVSHVRALPMDQQAFHMGLEYPYKRSFRSSAGHDSVKYLANAAAHGHCGDPL